jgi:hypothetical protein
VGFGSAYCLRGVTARAPASNTTTFLLAGWLSLSLVSVSFSVPFRSQMYVNRGYFGGDPAPMPFQPCPEGASQQTNTA